MKSYYNSLLALLTFFLLISLCACEKKAQNETDPTQQAKSNPSQAVSAGHHEALRITVPDGTCADLLAQIPAEELTLFLQTDKDSTAAKTALQSGNVDLILLSPQNAAELYRNQKKVQVFAVVTPATPSDPDRMECLVGNASVLHEKGEQLDQLLAAYQARVEQANEQNAILASGYDMMDLVQSSLEAQYEQTPDPSHSIPDGDFYFIPS